ncbi:Pin-related site-specific recombinase/DNA invertase [Carnobacterium maltaromaticum]|uniref:recombinase family protein n=1 Tax=Carnobacterium maltaromaticum TaxID=2751 RepID=UPI001073EFA1|nr:recombinase family protein [Carnobacterium maltaromaticum]TFJ56373.1 Pin-related site-specific recombinase/DNA invertase [Carnobacterium maltaromaticum]
MSRIGYARVSSKDQNLERQLLALEECSKIFSDKLSGKDTQRPQLQEMLNFIRENDIVVVSELDRLGRNNEDLTAVMNAIQDKGATLEILNLPTLKGIEDDNLRRLINNLIIEIYKYQAESERERIKERQQQGIDLAKDKGFYKGRKKKFKQNDPQLLHAFELYLTGEHTLKELERITRIPENTFRRYRQLYNIEKVKRKI